MTATYRAPFSCWDDAWWVVGPHVEMVIVPRINRIVRFGRPGSANLLWIDPDAESGPALPWKNWGGEKLWLWPQDRWSELGGDWPPPTDPGPSGEVLPRADGLDWRIAEIDGCPAIRRELRMGDGCITVRSFWEEQGASSFNFLLWSVTQIPNPEWVEVNKLHGDGGWHWMQDSVGQDPIPQSGGWVWGPERDVSSKCGFAAGELRTRELLLQSSHDEKTENKAAKDWRTSGAQIYFDTRSPMLRPAHLPRYAELEFLAPSNNTPLVMVWRLTH